MSISGKAINSIARFRGGSYEETLQGGQVIKLNHKDEGPFEIDYKAANKFQFRKIRIHAKDVNSFRDLMHSIDKIHSAAVSTKFEEIFVAMLASMQKNHHSERKMISILDEYKDSREFMNAAKLILGELVGREEMLSYWNRLSQSSLVAELKNSAWPLESILMRNFRESEVERRSTVFAQQVDVVDFTDGGSPEPIPER